eukprot:1599371-Rhodomonas_salina.1
MLGYPLLCECAMRLRAWLVLSGVAGTESCYACLVLTAVRGVLCPYACVVLTCCSALLVPGSTTCGTDV